MDERLELLLEELLEELLLYVERDELLLELEEEEGRVEREDGVELLLELLDDVVR